MPQAFFFFASNYTEKGLFDFIFQQQMINLKFGLARLLERKQPYFVLSALLLTLQHVHLKC